MIQLPGRIPLVIHPSFWVLALLIGFLNASSIQIFFEWVVIVFISVLFHELGHALMALLCNQRARIELGGIGGVTIRQGGSLSRGQEFLVVLMGPLFGLLLCAISYVLLPVTTDYPGLSYFLYISMIANLFWSIMNLLPIHPLDGGKLMAISFDTLFGLWGVRFSYLLSTLFAIACTAIFIAYGFIIGGAIFLLCAFESYRSWQTARVSRVGSGEEKVINELESAEFDWKHSQPEKAILRLEEIVKKQAKGTIYFRAVEMLSGFLLSSGQLQKAYALLYPLKDTVTGDTLKQFQLICYKLGYWELSLETGKKAFLEEQDISCAILNAFCSAHLSKVEAAVNWLMYVKRSKTVNMQSILKSEDFDGIRQSVPFQQFTAR